MVYIVMGVSGCGKTTVGRVLAQRLSLPFFDADSFHSPECITKMKAGIPLSDEDRIPWLTTLAKQIEVWQRSGGSVLACSALKETYRQMLKKNCAGTVFIHLRGDRDLILSRMAHRRDHFMPAQLLDSQLGILEEPEDCVTVDISGTPEQIVDAIVQHLNDRRLLR